MNYKESFLEITWIIKTSLTTIWFWFPILVVLAPMIELWVFFMINPLLILILPAAVTVAALRIDAKRTRARYLMGDKNNPIIRPIGLGPEFLADWNDKEKVKEYLETLNKADKDQDSNTSKT